MDDRFVAHYTSGEQSTSMPYPTASFGSGVSSLSGLRYISSPLGTGGVVSPFGQHPVDTFSSFSTSPNIVYDTNADSPELTNFAQPFFFESSLNKSGNPLSPATATTERLMDTSIQSPDRDHRPKREASIQANQRIRNSVGTRKRSSLSTSVTAAESEPYEASMSEADSSDPPAARVEPATPTNKRSAAAKRGARNRKVSHAWAKKEDEVLRELVEKHGPSNWRQIAEKLNARIKHKNKENERTGDQCSQHYLRVLASNLKKGQWDVEEDRRLMEYVREHGTNSWRKVASHVKTRNDIQCRYRFCRFLRTAQSSKSSKPLKGQLPTCTTADEVLRIAVEWGLVSTQAGRSPQRTPKVAHSTARHTTMHTMDDSSSSIPTLPSYTAQPTLYSSPVNQLPPAATMFGTSSFSSSRPGSVIPIDPSCSFITSFAEPSVIRADSPAQYDASLFGPN